MIWRFKLWRIQRRDRAFERAWKKYKKTVTPPVLQWDKVEFRDKWESK